MSTYRQKRRRRHAGASHFALVPFIDMMTILVVFLLAHTADVDILPNTAGGYDLDALSLFMRQVKSQYPDMTDASVLSGPAVSYDNLVQVMDTVRVYQLPVAPFSKAELFPDIAIGDAPT